MCGKVHKFQCFEQLAAQICAEFRIIPLPRVRISAQEGARDEAEGVIMHRIGRWYLPLIALLAAALIGALAMLAVDRAARVAALDEVRAEAGNDAAILAAGLESELNKFSLVPRVLAVDPEVAALLAGQRGQQAELNRRLAALARQTNAAAIYLMTADGLTLAASNWDRPDSFVGSNYGFRDYFAGAMRAGTYTEFALGTVSRRPGLYIAERVGPAGRPLGVVAVKVEFDSLERQWRDAKGSVFVTDADGVVVLASNAEWRFRATGDAPSVSRDPARDTMRFGVARLAPLTLPAPITMVEKIQPIAPLGWELHLLSDPAPQLAAAIANGQLMVLLGLVLAGIAGGSVFVWLRRRQAQARAALAEQTAMLREQLHQANRLATLGQVTAGLGHEIRQPLAAMQVYAESGERLLAAGRADEAAANFGKIAGLAGKIGQITAESLQFSRRTPREPKAIALAEVIDGSLLLLNDQIRRRSIQLVLPDPAQTQVRVLAQHVQLEQVLVNLVQNALQACDDGGLITISIAAGGDAAAGQYRLSVADDGPGIPADIRERLFQPFITTKPDGIGLGLAIARDIMRDSGGDLIMDQSASGSCFTMVIPVA